MNHQDQDKILNDLYQQANQQQPPEALDDLILKHAKNTTSQAKVNTKDHRKKSWRPWLAAASVVLVIPMIWLLTQDQQLNSGLDQVSNFDTAEPAAADKSLADEAGGEAEAMDQDDVNLGGIAVTGSRVRSQPEAMAPAPMVDLQQKIEAQGQRSITGKPIDQESLQANKKILMDEFKAKKRSIKPSTMDPLMALEYEQFGRYLEQGEIEAADQLLSEMQENWPDFDFEDMIYRLAEAEIGDQ